MPPLTVISVRDLVVGFGDRTVLDHVSLDVRKGEILGLVGGSGSGKSVFLRTIIGLLPKRSGKIDVFGQNIDDVGDERATICSGEPAYFSRMAHCSRR